MFLPLNSFENICVCFLLMIIYSTAGWVGEMIYHSIVIKHLSEKRGFLNGFLCPIYGHGALLVLYVLNGGLKNPLLTFLAGMVLTTALEYFTSWMMEAIFHMRWWDYSNCKYQINGRICLTNCIFFGLGCVLLCHVVNPPVLRWLMGIGPEYTVPVASFIILALVWLNSQSLSLFISALMVFPPVYLNVLEGICRTDRRLLEMARVFRVPFGRRLRGIYLPQVMPYFRTAVSLGLGLCWKAGAAAEIIGLPAGSMGERLYTAKVYFQTADLFAWTVTIVAVSVVFERLFLALVDRLMGKAGL